MSCSPLFLSIFRRRRARRIPRRHSDVTSRTWCNGLFFSNRAHTRWEHFCFRFFSTSAASRPIFFPITGIRLLISGKALDRSDRLSRLLRAFSYDRFKIYLIVPIVWIELICIQAIEVVSDVWVVWDRPGSVPHLVVPIVWTLFETTGTIGTIICMENRL